MNPIPIPIAYGPVTDRATTHFIGDVAIPPLPVVRVPSASHDYRIHQIADRVARRFGITLEALMLHRRSRGSAWPRQIAMYVLFTTTPVTANAIGAFFGLTRHAVYHAYYVVLDRMESDPKTCAEVKAIVAQLNK